MLLEMIFFPTLLWESVLGTRGDALRGLSG